MKALDVAKYVITLCVNEKRPISNLQLQKILYFIQVAFMKTNRGPCFEDAIEAWKLGPVVRSVYNKYCSYGALKIRKEYIDVNLELDNASMTLLDDVVKDKCRYDAWTLVRETHAEGGPWKRVYGNGEGNGKVISTGLMRIYG